MGTPPTTSSKRRRKKKCKPINVNNYIPPIKFNNRNNNTSKPSPPIVNSKFPSIFNLARANLTPYEQSVLNKGLKYCPTPHPPNSYEYDKAIHDFRRKLLLFGYFLNDTPSAPPLISPDANLAFQAKHKNKSTWIPQRSQIDFKLYNFIEELDHGLKNLPPKHTRFKDNLCKLERKALSRLMKRKDIIIRSADKGSGIVILTPQQYEEEAYKQLNNDAHYKELPEDIIPTIQQKIKDNINTHVATGALPLATAKHMITPNPRPGRFYLLPKIHKNLQHPPGRPIVASNNHPTEKLSEYVDQHLKEFIPNIASHIKDTNHFVEICNNIGPLPANARIVTFDVGSLYTNIPHQDGLIALEEFMTQYKNATTAKMLKQMAQIVLENNILEFNSKLYLQIHGTSMGSKMAPSYATIFLDRFETKYLPHAPFKPHTWKRYLDDIFAIFTCTDEELQIFTSWLNNLHPTIKFTAEFNETGVPFLDTYVSISNGQIILQPYTKKTDTKQYIEPSSCHPPHIFTSLPFSQALRLKRICTREDDLHKELANLARYFKNRSYPPDMIKSSIEKALQPRDTTNGNESNNTQVITLIIPFHPTNPRFSNHIKQLMEKHEIHLKDYNFRPIVAFTRPRNLRELLTRAQYGESAIPSVTKPTDSVIFRLTRSYDRNQLKAPVKHVLFHCEDHHELHDEFNSINESIASPHFKVFIQNHNKCHKINITPVNVTHKSTVFCTECKFKNNIISEKRTSRIEKELWNITIATHNALLRKPANHHKCSPKCITCKHSWQSSTVTTHEGTNFRLMKFNCNASNVIYIIHCTRCSKNYVGLTTNKLKHRMAGHLSSILNRKNTSIARHFNSQGHSTCHFKVAIMDHTLSKADLQIREAHWITQLQCVYLGINEKEEANYHLDYQVILLSRHFRHSKSCMPYLTHQIQDMKTMDLKIYKRIPLKKRK